MNELLLYMSRDIFASLENRNAHLTLFCKSVRKRGDYNAPSQSLIFDRKESSVPGKSPSRCPFINLSLLGI